MSDSILKLFRETNALLEGHFELSSGKHSDQYFQCALVLQHPHYAEVIAKEIAEQVKGLNVTCVIGPALGGVTIAYELGRQIGCRAIFAERKSGPMKLRRGFSVDATDRILIVEDVVTTGGSILEVHQLMESIQANVVGFAAIVDRTNNQVAFPHPFTSLLEMQPNVFDPADCPLCKEGQPITKPGSKK